MATSVSGSGTPGSCGWYSQNRDYATESLDLKAERERSKLAHLETLEELEARLGKLCELCVERNLDTTEFGGALAYYACSDVYSCEGRRKAKSQELMSEEDQIREALTRRA